MIVGLFDLGFGQKWSISKLHAPQSLAASSEYSRLIGLCMVKFLQCTEVKKGEINYSEILLFQASLGYF